MNAEKRQHERFNVTLEGAFSYGSFVCSNSIINISLGGLCMECGRAIDQDQELSIILPTRPPLKVRGQVAWCRKDGLSYLLGLRFTDLDQEQKKTLVEFISSLYWRKAMCNS